MSNLYFNHPYSLRNQTEILELRSEFGLNGYAIYIMLIEMMAESEYSSINKDLVNGLAMSFGCEIETLKKVINKCIQLQLFRYENEKIYSSHLEKHLAKRAEISKKRRLAGAKGGQMKSKSQANAKQMLSKKKQSLANKIKEKKKEIKEKYKKEKVELAETIIPFYNNTHEKQFKNINVILENYVYWRAVYSLEEIQTAITNLNHPDWWARDKSDLILLFRQKNKNGQCDYINELINLKPITGSYGINQSF